MPVEMAVERALKRQPKIQRAPKDAMCYICLEGDGEQKLMRGCACRGDSAGFVHLECLVELAKSKLVDDEEEQARIREAIDAWLRCGNCKQNFTGALELEMKRRFWRYHRSGRRSNVLGYNAMTSLATCLGIGGEIDVDNHLKDEASQKFGGNHKALHVNAKISKADMLATNGQHDAALDLLKSALPESMDEVSENPDLFFTAVYQQVRVLLALHRDQEAYEAACTLVVFAKAHYKPEDVKIMSARKVYAVICGNLGRIDESKAIFEDLLTAEIRILGRDHLHTQDTREYLQQFGFS